MTWAAEKLANGKASELTEAELLGLIIGNEQTANAVIERYGGFKGMAGQPLEKFLSFNGLGEAKIIRMAASFEMARRVVDHVLEIEHRGRLF
jgi:DNA repair protein RadC